MEPKDEPVTREEVEEIEDMVVENKKLLEENNKLLKKIHRSNVWAFWLRIVWFAIILGVPFITYYYVLEPYIDSLGPAFKLFGVELPF